MNSEAELITLADFAKLLQVSIRQIYFMDAAGRLGPQRICLGRAVRFHRQEVTDWLRAGCPRREAWDEQRRNCLSCRKALDCREEGAS